MQGNSRHFRKNAHYAMIMRNAIWHLKANWETQTNKQTNAKDYEQ